MSLINLYRLLWNLALINQLAMAPKGKNRYYREWQAQTSSSKQVNESSCLLQREAMRKTPFLTSLLNANVSTNKLKWGIDYIAIQFFNFLSLKVFLANLKSLCLWRKIKEIHHRKIKTELNYLSPSGIQGCCFLIPHVLNNVTTGIFWNALVPLKYPQKYTLYNQ